MRRSSGSGWARGTVRGAAGVIGAAILLAGAGGPAPADDVDGVPVVGQGTAIPGYDADDGKREVVITLHGVRRVEGATIVYWSAGLTPESDPGNAWNISDAFGPQDAGLFKDSSAPTGDVGIIDPEGRRMYATLGTTEDDGTLTCLCSDPLVALTGLRPGQVGTLYAVLAPLPEGLERVDVALAGRVFSDVPVGAEPMVPALESDEPILVGTAWPKVDLEPVADVDADDFVYPLTDRADATDVSLTSRRTEDRLYVDLAADVLFPVGKATLGAEARHTLDRAAERIGAETDSGSLTVSGHTDSDGTDASNRVLSLRRARAAAEQLERTLPPGFTVVTEGKGESEPIASNATDEGKSKNRRVTILLGGGK